MAKVTVRVIQGHWHLQNVENGMVWDCYGSLKVIGSITIQKSSYDFLFIFSRNYVSVLYVPFLRNSELFVKICQLYPSSPTFGKGVTPFEFRQDLWLQKTRVPGLSCGIVCMFLCLAILVEQRLVTDTDTDRQTDTDTWS